MKTIGIWRKFAKLAGFLALVIGMLLTQENEGYSQNWRVDVGFGFGTGYYYNPPVVIIPVVRYKYRKVRYRRPHYYCHYCGRYYNFPCRKRHWLCTGY